VPPYRVCSLGSQIDITIHSLRGSYVYFKVLGLFNEKIFDFTITLSKSGVCVCKSFNVLGIAKATLCFCFKDSCIQFTYDIQSVAGNWKGTIKLMARVS
jgi:hypothetical protein